MAKFACLDLAEVARKVVADNIDMIDLKHQEISFEGESVEVYADPFAVETLVQNLLANAVKYTPVDGRLLIRAFVQQGKAVLQLMDSGAGIPESEYDRVFERFYRVGGDRHRSAVIGCGLGLSIVKHIVDLHEAKIKLSSSDFDSGLCVTVTFPEKYLCEQGGRKPGERV
jgi:two-component system sensor histidine kinase QseC